MVMGRRRPGLVRWRRRCDAIGGGLVRLGVLLLHRSIVLVYRIEWTPVVQQTRGVVHCWVTTTGWVTTRMFSRGSRGMHVVAWTRRRHRRRGGCDAEATE